MNRIMIQVCVLSAMHGIVTSSPAQTTVGGFKKASVTKNEVVDAASFAVKAQAKAMQDLEAGKPATLELVKILAAEEQVVSGMNYRLTLKVIANGDERQAEATVWWQAWRKPGNPYQLTSWKWIGDRTRGN